jgi:hypothetical protein
MLLATDLNSLRGPSRGTVELPLRLYWSGPSRRAGDGRAIGGPVSADVVLGVAREHWIGVCVVVEVFLAGHGKCGDGG